MYCDYFKLITHPFLDGNYFNNIRLLAAQDFIRQTLNQGGIAIIGGNKGVGKTRLAHEIARESQRKVLNLSAVAVNDADKESLGQLLACCFHLKKWRTLPTSILPLRIAEFFGQTENTAQPWLIVVDNAENLCAESYEFLRTFKSYPQSSRISFLLVEERKGISVEGKGCRKPFPHTDYHLLPMSFTETSEYLSQRLQSAGAEPALIHGPVAKLLHNASGGRFQLINELAADSLNSAYAEKTPSVTYRQMKVCIEARGLMPGRKKCLTLLIASYMLFGGILGWTYFNYAKPYLPLPVTLSQKLHEIPAGANTISEVGSNERHGMRQLFQVWGYDVSADDAFCDQAARAQLTCKKGTAILDTLIEEGMPWLSPISVDGQTVYVTVVKVTDETLDILIKGDTWTVQRNWFDSVWAGEYTQLLPQTPSGKSVINNTSPETDTAWLDMTLSKILNLPFSKTGRWDNDLTSKIKLFQQRENLAVDGRVGKGTLIQIAKRTGNMPELLTNKISRSKMQNIHLSAYTSHLNKQKVKVAVRRSLRKSLYCLMFIGLFLFAGGLAGSYLHLAYLNWQSHRIAVSEESHLPYKQSPLHYIYKNRTLPAVNQTASIDDNSTPEDELPVEAADAADDSATENEAQEDAPVDESDDNQIMALEKKSPDMPLQEWLNKAMIDQQQEEKSAK